MGSNPAIPTNWCRATLVAEYSRRVGPVSFQPDSTNRKLSPVEFQKLSGTRWKRPISQAPRCCSTYVSIKATCPSSCTFKNSGCYVQHGITGRASRILDEAAGEVAGDEVIAIEAQTVNRQFPEGVPQDGARGGRDLRFHIGGDVSSETGARMLAESARLWRSRGGGAVWMYTHRWREIPHAAWGGHVEVLASVETVEGAQEAQVRGYTPALTVTHFRQKRAYRLQGLRIVPCPAQTRHRTCVECRLCLRKLPEDTVIAFELHGAGASRVRPRLPVLDQMGFEF